ncbi:MAG: type II toxin-antitoxin system RelE family toxin [Neisseriaceae bacterium]|jgi:mRNA interferase RelE/StbE
MRWQIIFETTAAKKFAKLDKKIQQRIGVEIDRIIQSDNPRKFGKALSGNLSGLWRYRVGDYRIVCKIEDSTLIIVVVRVANRKDVYR